MGPGGILVERAADVAVWQDALSRLWDDAEVYAALSRAARISTGLRVTETGNAIRGRNGRRGMADDDISPRSNCAVTSKSVTTRLRTG